MPTINHLQRHVSIYGTDRKLFTAAAMVFFFVTFDGTLMFLAPIVMTKAGLSIGTVGLIIGLSSVFGLVFDLLLGRLLQKSSFRLMFFLMLIVAMTYPFFLFGASTITLYLVAMAVWGLYYNLYNMATIDFVENTNTPIQFASSFGILKVFDGMGNLVAPFIGSIMIVASLTRIELIEWPMVLILIALAFYTVLAISTKQKPIRLKHPEKPSLGFLLELKIWSQIGHILLPTLILTLAINLVDSAIWTIGPVFSQDLAEVSHFGGGLMVAYTLPPLLVGWFVGYFVARFGKKNTALAGLLVGSLFATMVGFITLPIILIGVIFCTSFGFSLAWPTINSAYADYIRADHSFSKEIEAVEDWFTNLGDMIGPIVGGYSAQFLGNAHSFIAIGIFGVTASLILFWFTPNKINPKIVLAQ
jgi:predicted MFS family arabinose efflux permease